MPQIDDWQVQASAEVDAPAAEVFDWICRPSNHVLLDGSGNVRGALRDKRLSAVGEKFTMRMHWILPYVVRSRVSEFEEGRLIAWNHIAKHRWRWEVEPLGDDRCRVTETFDATEAPAKAQYEKIGFPEAYQQTLDASVAKVAEHFSRAGAGSP